MNPNKARIHVGFEPKAEAEFQYERYRTGRDLLHVQPAEASFAIPSPAAP
jgi:hypothetical protein